MTTLHHFARWYGWSKDDLLEMTPAEIDFLGTKIEEERRAAKRQGR